MQEQIVIKQILKILHDPNNTHKAKDIELFFKNGVNPDSVIIDSTGETVVSVAAFTGEVDVLKIAKKYNANFDVVNVFNSTPLHQACLLYGLGKEKTKDFKNCILFLIEQMKNINVVDLKRNSTPLDELYDILKLPVSVEVVKSVEQLVKHMEKVGAQRARQIDENADSSQR